MSGVVFIVCIPTEKYEKCLRIEINRAVRMDDRSVSVCRKNLAAGMVLGGKPTSKQGAKKKAEEVYKEHGTMEKILASILQDLSITNSTWCKRDQDDYLQVIFSIDCGDRCDEILKILKENHIGQKFNSIVSVVPCSIQYNSQQEFGFLEEEQDVNEDCRDKHTGWHRFLSTVRARLTVAQVVENVKMHAALTFDFLFLILISTTMCAIGLVENSNVYLLSSMVICPMMGPVMAGTFGSVIEHRRLLKTGIQNELLGLGIATVVGFCYGSVITSITDKYGSQTWPTYEMLSRGEIRSLWVGSLIALLSGAVVALGILSDNIASLVGVAISTSLTPPAVNAGLFWSMASVRYFKGDGSAGCPNLTLNYNYSENCITELMTLGAVSLCLTFSNIICIYAAGILIFKMKEVAPMSSKDSARRRFWKHDIKIARDYIKTVQKEPDCIISKLSEEISQFQRSRHHENLCHSTDLSKDNSKIDIKRSEYTWSPCMYLARNPDITELNDLYEDLLKRKDPARTFRGPKQYHYRRLSQIFVRDEEKLAPIKEGNADKHRLLSDLSSSTERSSSSRQVVSGKKTFFVTPCKSDLLLP